MISYFNGHFMNDEEVFISPHDRGFNFADGTYEVFRSFSGKLFYAEEHVERLKYSLAELKIDYRDTEALIPAALELVRLNDLGQKEASIYLQITRGSYKRMHPFPNEKIEPTVYMNIKEFVPYTEFIQNGIKCILLPDIRWHRCDIKTIALLPNIMAKQQATEASAYEAIFVRDGIITEGTHTNFFGIKKGVVYTHPKSNFILSGVSREIVIAICNENDMAVVEEGISAFRLLDMDELFIAGTSTEVMPVIQIDENIIGNGSPGTMTSKIQNLFKEHILSYLNSR